MKWKVLLIVVLLVASGLAVGASMGLFGASPTASASDYLTAQAATTDVVAQVAATGSVAPSASWGLSFGTVAHAPASSSASNGNGSAVTWPVTKVNVKVGDAVTKGEVLATASTTDIDAQIEAANRAWKNTRIQLSQANAQLDAATTDTATQQGELGVNNAETAEANARQAVRDLTAQRKLASITAPAAGVVTTVSVTSGTDAPSGDAIQIAANPLQVTTSVAESDINSITIGQTAEITIAALGSSTVQGTVASIAPTGSAGNSGVVSFDVVITLLDAPTGLRPGMSADVTITTASASSVLAIPSRALQGTAGAYRVRLLHADGSVTAANVEVGLITDSLAEIKSGLQAGDTVITGTSSSQNTNSTTTNGRGGFQGPGGGVQVFKGG
jgi:membrane fusion protein, macrolide-specific efflux system